MIKGLRRSIKGGDKHSSNVPQNQIGAKNALTILPPKKIIKALYDYTPASDQELGFSRGDFFHVIGHEDDTEWYEACNPATGARGMVPVSYFQALGKQERDSQSSVQSDSKRTDDSGYSPSSGGSVERERNERVRKSISTKAGGPLYGTVIYNFEAERADELNAKAGEAIIVIAQSNEEWFLAKPIGRLGGPGLIPVSFIEIKDMASGMPVANPQEAILRAQVPKVEDWKKQAAEYKNSSIALGSFSFGGKSAPVEEVLSDMTIAEDKQETFELLAPVRASVDRYAFENGRYWYVLQAEMEDGRHWSLCRYYEDFYDFQIALLKEFPVEAGATGEKRKLPFMPGPVTYVTDSISSQRRASLDTYIKEIMAMEPRISKSVLVRHLFTPKEGDIESGPQHYPRHSSLLQQQPPLQTHNRDSQLSHQSSDSSPGPSRQGSRVDLNGNMRGNGSYPNVLSPPPQHRTNGAQAPRNGNGTNGYDNPSHLRQNSDLQPPRILRGESSMSASTVGSSQSTSFMKVKVHFQDDLIAIRLPSDISLLQLQQKLEQRLDTRLEVIQYRDEANGDYYELISDQDLTAAMQRNSKLVLSVS